MDLQHLEETLTQHRGGSGQVIGCFAAASNVTGAMVDDVTVTQLLHRYSALAFWDYATAGEADGPVSLLLNFMHKKVKGGKCIRCCTEPHLFSLPAL